MIELRTPAGVEKTHFAVISNMELAATAAAPEQSREQCLALACGPFDQQTFHGREFVYAGKGLRFKPIRTGRWWDASSQNEIDIVATDGETRAFVAECKWGHVDMRDLRKLQERTQLMLRELDGVESVKYALFSRHTPIDRALLDEISSGRVMWLGLQSLFPGPKR